MVETRPTDRPVEREPHSPGEDDEQERRAERSSERIAHPGEVEHHERRKHAPVGVEDGAVAPQERRAEGDARRREHAREYVEKRVLAEGSKDAEREERRRGVDQPDLTQ